MRLMPQENQKALDTVIDAINTAIADYQKWPDNSADDIVKELEGLKKSLNKNSLRITCGGRF
jgi:hypothetical protein